MEKENNQVLAIEIKAGQTYNKDYLKNLKNFPLREAEKRLIYSGEQGFEVSGISILGWREAMLDGY